MLKCPLNKCVHQIDVIYDHPKLVNLVKARSGFCFDRIFFFFRSIFSKPVNYCLLTLIDITLGTLTSISFQSLLHILLNWFNVFDNFR